MKQPITITSPIDHLDPDALERLQIRESGEILSILRRLLRDQTPLTLYLDADNYLSTYLLGVFPEENQLIFAVNPIEADQCNLPQDSLLLAVGIQHKIKLQFSCLSLQRTEHEGNPAFITALPASIIKLQRRAYFRIPLPLINPALCTLIPEDSQNSTYTILDISLGGIGILGFDPAQYPAQPGLFHGCQISLPEVGVILASLQLKNYQRLRVANGKEFSRSGFAFVNLKTPMEHLISRFIMKLEREQKSVR